MDEQEVINITLHYPYEYNHTQLQLVTDELEQVPKELLVHNEEALFFLRLLPFEVVEVGRDIQVRIIH